MNLAKSSFALLQNMFARSYSNRGARIAVLLDGLDDTDNLEIHMIYASPHGCRIDLVKYSSYRAEPARLAINGKQFQALADALPALQSIVGDMEQGNKSV